MVKSQPPRRPQLPTTNNSAAGHSDTSRPPRSSPKSMLQEKELKIQQQEEKLMKQQSQIKEYVELVSQLQERNKTLRFSLTSDGVKFQELDRAFLKNSGEFERLKLESDKMSELIKDAMKEHRSLVSRQAKKRSENEEQIRKVENLELQLKAARKRKEILESLLHGLQQDN